MDIRSIQNALKDASIGGWLFYDFHNRDVLAYRVLGLDFGKLTSRRWFYYIPATGNPIRLAHKVEPSKLDSLPGVLHHYLAWKDLHKILKDILGSPKKIAMQYSPLNHIPYVSIVDAGTVDLIRSFGHEVVSSADLVQQFEAVIDAAGYESHLSASVKIHRIKDDAFGLIESTLRSKNPISEYEVQQFIIRRFNEEGLTCDNELPIVGVNDHPANPHFEPTPENTYMIRKGDTVLIDLWAREMPEGSIWADITWCGFTGKNPPEQYVEIFNIVRNARDTGVAFVRDRFAKGIHCHGWEVDDAVREVIRYAGYGEHFIHRTGHSIGREVHAHGVNIDNLETKEERRLIPGICFSIEPGIYLEGEMAVRSEVDVFITLDHEVVVAGTPQQELICMNV